MRTAHAHLQVTAQDQELREHVQLLDQVKDKWGTLKAFVEGISNPFSASFIDGTKSLAKLLGKEQGDAAKRLASGFSQMAAYTDQLSRSLPKFNETISKTSDILADMSDHLAFVAVAMEDLAKTLKTGPLTKYAASLGQIAKSQTELTDGIRRMAASAGQSAVVLQKNRKTVQGLAKDYQTISTAMNSMDKVAGKKSTSMKKLTQDFIRNASALFIMYHWAKQLFSLLEEATQRINLRDTLTVQVANFKDVLGEANKATQGLVSELELMRGMAQFQRLGIGMDDFTRSLQHARTIALATGQSTEQVFDYMSRGVQRLSPTLLANLGITVNLSEAYLNFAAASGKATSELTDQEKRQAALQQVMALSSETFGDAAVGASKWTSAVERGKTALSGLVDSAVDWVAEGIGRALMTEADRIAESATKMEASITRLRAGLDNWKSDEFVGFVVDTMVEAEAKLEAYNLRSQGVIKSWQEIAEGILGAKAENEKYTASVFNSLEVNERLADFIERSATGAQLWHLQHTEFFDVLQDISELNAESLERWRAAGWDLKGLMDDPTFKRFGTTGDEAARGFRAAIDELAAGAGEYLANLKRMSAEQVHILGLGKTAREQELIKQEAQRALDAERLRIIKEINTQGLSLLFRAGAYKDILKPISDIWADVAKNSSAANNTIEQMLATERARLDQQNEAMSERTRQLTGQTRLAQQAAELETRLSAATRSYNEAKAESVAMGAASAKYSTDQVEAMGKQVIALQDELVLIKEKAKLQSLWVKHQTDLTHLTKQERDAQALIISGGRTRLQLLEDIKKVKAEELLMQDKLNALKQQEFRTVLEIAAISALGPELGGLAAEGMFAAAVARMDKDLQALQEKGGQLVEWLNNFTVPRGGGRGGGDKETSKRIEEIFEVGGMGDPGTFATEFDRRGNKFKAISIEGFFGIYKDVYERSKDGILSFVGSKKVELWEDYFKILVPEQNMIDRLSGWQDTGIVWRPEIIVRNMEKALDQVEKKLEQLKGVDNEHAEFMREFLETTKLRLEGELASAMELKGLFDDMQGVAKDTATAMSNAFAFKGVEDFFGQAGKQAIDEVTDSFSRFADVLGQDVVTSYDLFAASMPMMRGITRALTDEKKKQAAVEAAMNAAAAWAAFPNAALMTTHGTAALMYAAVAGGAIKLPGGASSAKKEPESRRGGPLHVHLYGDSIATDGERAMYIEQTMARARAEGYFE